MPNSHHTFSGDFKKFFLRGLGILLPSVLTLWIVVQAYQFVERSVAQPINSGIRSAIIEVLPRVVEDQRLPEWFQVTDDQVARRRAQRQESALRHLTDDDLRAQIRAQNFRDWWDSHWYVRGIGLIVAIVLIYLAGRLLGGYIGRRIYLRLESMITRLPVIKQIYPSVKQIVEFLMGGEQKIKFNRVVLVEYPRHGIYTVGLMTGSSMRDIESAATGDCITVFIPSSPTPFTGYTITVRKEDAIDLPITIDEALKFVVSGGVLVPEKQTIDPDTSRSERVIASAKQELESRGTTEASDGDSSTPRSEAS
ncbi:MAG: DUF502 domain-containing protein [Planctomycetota bacterium]|jgi:uncharacterized membrane protein